MRFFNAGFNECVRQILHIGGRQVQTFGACGRHDVRCIACQEQGTKAHRLCDKTAQGCNAFFDAGASDQLLAGFGVESKTQLLPKGIVRPLLDLVGQGHLQVITAADGAAL